MSTSTFLESQQQARSSLDIGIRNYLNGNSNLVEVYKQLLNKNITPPLVQRASATGTVLEDFLGSSTAKNLLRVGRPVRLQGLKPANF